MLRTPTEFELNQLMHRVYDPVKAREYYLRTRELKGRKKGKVQPVARGKIGVKLDDPRTGKTQAQIHREAKVKQRKELTQRISNLESRLQKLDAAIRKRAQEEASEDRKGKAKKERAAKERDKPDSAAEKAEAARENKKYREKNQQKLKNDAKKDSSKSSGGGSKSKGSSGSKRSTEDLQVLATKVRGQIAVAKAKLAAL